MSDLGHETLKTQCVAPMSKELDKGFEGRMPDHEGHMHAHLQYLCNYVSAFVDKMRGPVAGILTWPWLTSSLHICGQYMAVDSIKRTPPSALGMTGWQGCKAAEEQSRG